MRLSFIIPTRNQAGFLGKCIESCLTQHLQDFEIIVADGASNDETRQVLDSFGDTVRWFSEPDDGQSDAVNKAVQRARGEVIAWINSDDFYANHEVLGQVLAEFEDPDVDIVYGDGQMLDAADRPMRNVRGRAIDDKSEVIVRATPFAMQPAIFFRRQLFLDCGMLRTDLHLAMDYDLWLRMVPRARKVKYIPKCLACATYHPQAKSVRRLLEQVRELHHLKREHRANYRLTFLQGVRMRLGIVSLYLYWLAVHLGLRRAS